MTPQHPGLNPSIPAPRPRTDPVDPFTTTRGRECPSGGGFARAQLPVVLGLLLTLSVITEHLWL